MIDAEPGRRSRRGELCDGVMLRDTHHLGVESLAISCEGKPAPARRPNDHRQLSYQQSSGTP